MKRMKMEASVLKSAFFVVMLANAAFAVESPQVTLEGDIDNEESLFERSTCEDTNRWCYWYRDRGYCSTNHMYYNYMKENCPRTCDFCAIQPVTEPVGNGVEKVNVNVDECLLAHNTKRALHSAQPLTWDPTLAQQAEAYAIELAKTDNFDHDPNRGAVGENLQWFSTSMKSTTCKDAVKEWYDEEVNLYPFSNPPRFSNSNFAHFTQVVWKATKRLGAGIAKNRFRVYIVARYTPPGNLYRGFAENVGNKSG